MNADLRAEYDRILRQIAADDTTTTLAAMPGPEGVVARSLADLIAWHRVHSFRLALIEDNLEQLRAHVEGRLPAPTLCGQPCAPDAALDADGTAPTD